LARSKGFLNREAKAIECWSNKLARPSFLLMNYGIDAVGHQLDGGRCPETFLLQEVDTCTQAWEVYGCAAGQSVNRPVFCRLADDPEI